MYMEKKLKKIQLITHVRQIINNSLLKFTKIFFTKIFFTKIYFIKIFFIKFYSFPSILLKNDPNSTRRRREKSTIFTVSLSKYRTQARKRHDD